MLTSVNISPFSYNNIFIIRLDHSNIMDCILISEFEVVISSKLASCLQNAYLKRIDTDYCENVVSQTNYTRIAMLIK